MKNKGFLVTLIVLFSIVIVGLIVALVFVVNGKFKLGFNVRESKNLVLEREYDKEFESIKINTDMANIYIKNSDKIKLEVYGKENKTTVKDEKDLNVEIKDKCNGFCFNKEIFKVVLYLPESYSKDITIINDYGNIKVDKLNSLLDIDIDYGDITIDTVKDLRIKEDYGDIKINEVTNYFKIRSDYGDIKINKVDIKKDSSAKLDFGDIKINEVNDIFVDAHTDLGDVKVKNNNRKSDIILTIENDCGDIIVK